MALPFHKRRLDPDAAEFCRASGATDRRAISDFVRGMKGLGLWDSMVCWPLRSTQNAGTGTAVQSLGGLGSYAGSLIGGPTWNADGIYLDGTDDYADLSIIPTTTGNVSLYLTHKPTVDEDSNICACRTAQNLATNGGGFEVGHSAASRNSKFNIVSRYSSSLVQVSIAGAETLNAFHAYACRHDATNKKAGVMEDVFTSWSLSSTAPADFGPTNRSLKIGTNGGTDAASASTGYYAMLAMFQGIAMTEAQVASLHSLYKSTLGIGLGLP